MRIEPNDLMGTHIPLTRFPQSYPQMSWKTFNHLLRAELQE